MTHFIFILILTYLSSALSKSGRIFTCAVPACADCSLEINLNTEKTEYMNNESSHFLKMNSVDDKVRIFVESPGEKNELPRYKVIFNRAKKTATVISLLKDQTEKEVFKKAKCRLSTKAHDKLNPLTQSNDFGR